MDIRGQVRPDNSRLLEVAHELIEEAREVSDRTLARLHALCDQFPGDFTHGDLDLVAKMREHRAGERRRALRRKCRSLPMKVRVAGAEAEAVPSELIDRSSSGLAIRLPRPLDVGTFLELLPAGRTGSPLVAMVKHSEQIPDGWAIGCQILSGKLPF